MTTVRQLDANRRNAQQSTGPRTQRGKNIASLNAAKHGLYANAPVIPRLENPAHWEQHRASTIQSLAPSGALEHALAERIALILWRLGRVARYEQNVTTIAQRHARADLSMERPLVVLDDNTPDEVQDRLAQARRQLDALTRLAELPPTAPLSGKQALTILAAVAEQVEDFDFDAFSAPDLVPDDVIWEEFSGWTVDLVHRVVDAIAQDTGRDPAQLLQQTRSATRRWHNDERATHRRLVRQVDEIRSERLLPNSRKTDQVIRYEAHLMRQLTQTLAHLRTFQHARNAQIPHPDHESAGTNPIPAPIPPSHAVAPDQS